MPPFPSRASSNRTSSSHDGGHDDTSDHSPAADDRGPGHDVPSAYLQTTRRNPAPAQGPARPGPSRSSARPPRPKAAKPRPISSRWWEQQVTVPTALNVPVKKLRRRARAITIYLWIAAVLLPIVLFANAVLVARQLNPGTRSGQVSQTAASLGAAQAQVEIERWIAARPSPLPGGRVVTFTGSTTKTSPAQPDGTVPPPITTYAFVVADPSRNLFTTTVQMVNSDTTGAVAVAQPALLPIPPSDANAVGNVWPWPGTEQGSQQVSYAAAINAWSRAYTSGNPEVLKQAIGDPEQGRSYMPLSGLTLSTPSIGAVGAIWGSNQQRGTAQQPAQALVRVTFDVSWAGQSSTPSGSAGSVPRFTYDLLLDRADTASPVVVAWGSPGTELTPYANAVLGRTLAAAPTQAPPPSAPPSSATPRSTPPSSATPRSTPR